MSAEIVTSLLPWIARDHTSSSRRLRAPIQPVHLAVWHTEDGPLAVAVRTHDLEFEILA